jgi:hypothetical protein
MQGMDLGAVCIFNILHTKMKHILRADVFRGRIAYAKG